MLRRDRVELDVNGLRYDRFQTLEMSSDLYNPMCPWRIELGAWPKAKKGDRVEIHVNDQLELTGVVDRVERSYDRSSTGCVISGRSLMGLVEDSYITSFETPPQTITGAAQRFLADIPYVKECKVVLENPELDSGDQHHAMDVGDSVWRLLNEYAQNRGLLAWMKPNGTIVFGKAVTGGEPTFVLDDTRIEHGRMIEDISRMHSEIILVSDTDAHRKVSVTNDQVPLRKPFVAAYNGPVAGLERQAKNYLRQEKLAGFGMEYAVAGFSQGGTNWRVNTMVHVTDDRLGITGDYVLFRRLFRLDRQGGRFTQLSLGPVLEDPFKAFLKKGRKRHSLTSRSHA